MKKLVLIFLMMTQFGLSQVGINTTTPQAQLDIKSSNQVTPSNTDGILIPKIDAFPLTNPTALQQGMMVYLTTISAGKQPGFYYWDNVTVNWIGLGGGSASSGWETTGNVGTNPTINFVGTTDDNDLIFKRNNIGSGVISFYNTAFGNNVFTSNTTGNINTAFGSFALRSNTIGNSNTAVGVGSLGANTTGNWNTAVGADNMNLNNGSANVAVGSFALQSNVSGNNNTAVGTDALLSTTGSENIALGSQAGLSNQSGNSNIMIGNGTSVPDVNGSFQMSIGEVIYGADMSTTALGKIGIGVPVPTEKLEVAGKTKTTELQVTTGAVAGNVLTSDALGNATWQAPTGGLGTPDHDFYEVGTTTAPDAITDNMFHTGNVGIGNNNPTYKLDVDETVAGKIYAMRVRHSNPVDGSTTSGIQSTISSGSISSGNIQGVSTSITPNSGTSAKGLRNLIGGTSGADVTGVDNSISTSGVGSRTGVSNSFPGTGTGISYGMYNSFSNPNAVSLGVSSNFTAAGIRDKTGVDNTISNSTGGFHTGISNTFTNNNGAVEETGVYSKFTGSSVGNIRGIYNEITNSGSGNVHYGLYNNINGSGGFQRYGVENVLSGTSTGEQYGVENDISVSGGNSTHYGVRNYLTGTGTGYRIGTDNWISGSGSGDQYGVNNYIDNSGTGTKYGVSSNIPAATNGLHYGVYSNATKASGYAGYFLGRFSIGTTTANNYILPLSRGAVNQIMQTDGVGNVTWKNPNIALNGFAWTTTGNSGTNTATNFIGTTDDVDLIFKRNNVRAGLLSGLPNGNTSFGVDALNPASTGFFNTSVGYDSLNSNTTGNNNSAFGWLTLNSNTTGVSNSAFGSEVLKVNGTGTANSGFGNWALNLNTGGSYNSALGSNSLAANTWANNNIAIGYQVMTYQNFANGNVAYDANNVAIGVEALRSNNPTAITNGINNVAVGHKSLFTNSIGANNTALGFQAGDANTIGNNNISIGANSDVLNPAGSNQMSIANVIYGDAMDNITNARFSIGDFPSISNKFYTYSLQFTANGDGQSGVYGYRTRDSQNDGAGYSNAGTNKAVSGYNHWGDSYTFGVAGHCDNDYARSGGVLGSNLNGAYWSSLAYKNSASTTYAIYATAALATGTGKMAQSSQSSIGGGFYGGIIGSWSKGEIGNMNSGSLFASYNSGDEYTSGKQIEIVETNNGKKAAYTVTSTESVIYKKGKITLVNGTARIAFDSDYAALLGDIPVVTTTPMGQCNGIYIESIDKNGFTVKELNNGTSNVAVSWIAVGDRIDTGKTIQRDVLSDDFDSNVNEVMFNENNKQDTAKAMWSEGSKINFGKLPENLIEKPVKKEK